MEGGLVAWWAEAPSSSLSSFQRKHIVLGTISRAPNEASFYCYWLQKAEDAIIIINGMERSRLLYFLHEMLIFARVLG